MTTSHDYGMISQKYIISFELILCVVQPKYKKVAVKMSVICYSLITFQKNNALPVIKASFFLRSEVCDTY